MRRILLIPAVLLAIAAAGGAACTTESASAGDGDAADQAAEEAELARYMTNLQRWTHKTALAVEARNAELGHFYLHEMEETVATVREEAPTYEDHPVRELMDEHLVPAVAALDSTLEGGGWPAVDRRVHALQQACNECHRATGYGFVRIDLRDLSNPYAQRFDTASTP